MTVTVFERARIVDPSRGVDEVGAVVVEGKKIAGLLGETIQPVRKAETTVLGEAVMLLGIGLNWRDVARNGVPIADSGRRVCD